jgi:hypothetical protein
VGFRHGAERPAEYDRLRKDLFAERDSCVFEIDYAWLMLVCRTRGSAATIKGPLVTTVRDPIEGQRSSVRAVNVTH